MKKEDMIKERQDLLMNIGIDAAVLLHPFGKLLGAIGRVAFLQSEIDKVTPKPSPLQEVSNDKVVPEKASS